MIHHPRHRFSFPVLQASLGAWALVGALFISPPVLAQTPPATAAAADVTGHNVTSVTYQARDQRRGTLRQREGRRWVGSYNGSKEIDYFRETRRDDGSVFLAHVSGKFSLQLNLLTRKVMYTQGNDAPAEMYTILDADAGAPNATSPPAAGTPPPEAVPALPNGRNLTWVGYGALGAGREVLGYLRRQGAGEWHEVDASGKVVFRFQEVQRDDWSVYLVDRSRGVNLQLDVHTNKVMYSEGNGPRRELYQVLRKGNR